MDDDASDHATENDEPSDDRVDGVAPAVLSDEVEANWLVKPPSSEAPGLSDTAAAFHSGSEIVPVCPSVVVADAPEN